MRFLFFCLLSFLSFSVYCQTDSPVLDSMVQPQAFAPGVVSSRYEEWATSFTPDDQTVYFSRGGTYWTVCYSRKRNGVWQQPQVANFSGTWRDTDPFVAPDGKRLFFVSNRPSAGMPADKPGSVFHLWYVDLVRENEWSAPHPINGGVNLDSCSNYGPSVSGKGTLCWCSRDREGNKGMQGYYAVWLGDHYDQPKQIHVPGAASVQDPFLSADERFLVFLDGSDLYVSWRQGEEWGAAQRLPAQVNNGDFNSSPYVSRDGKTLYYSSGRIKGFYKRDYNGHPLDYAGLKKELDNCFNGSGNILMVPVHLAK